MPDLILRKILKNVFSSSIAPSLKGAEVGGHVTGAVLTLQAEAPGPEAEEEQSKQAAQ